MLTVWSFLSRGSLLVSGVSGIWEKDAAIRTLYIRRNLRQKRRNPRTDVPLPFAMSAAGKPESRYL